MTGNQNLGTVGNFFRAVPGFYFRFVPRVCIGLYQIMSRHRVSVKSKFTTSHSISMKRLSPAFLCLFVLLSLSGCQGAYSQKKAPLELPKFATPPVTITAPDARAEYILSHVWQDYTHVDSTMFRDRNASEQFLVNYFAIGDVAGVRALGEASKAFFSKSDAFADSVMIAMTEKYFGTAASPLFSDSLYLSVMDEARKAGKLSDAQKIVLADKIRLMGMNKPGSDAPDIEYLTPDGKTHRFREMLGRPTVLLIYNIGCSTCHALMQYLSDHSSYRRWVEEGKINLVAITSAEDRDLWIAEQKFVPDYAVSGLDTKMDIILKELLDVRAYPTLYFFDKELKVVAKDIQIDELTELISAKISGKI